MVPGVNIAVHMNRIIIITDIPFFPEKQFTQERPEITINSARIRNRCCKIQHIGLIEYPEFIYKSEDCRGRPVIYILIMMIIKSKITRLTGNTERKIYRINLPFRNKDKPTHIIDNQFKMTDNAISRWLLIYQNHLNDAHQNINDIEFRPDRLKNPFSLIRSKLECEVLHAVAPRILA
ncbi:hypothetical protein WL57_35975 [Burkholderia cepacia]|nr:hypothetical protein WL57_35975 [Burkholderia cepacia]